MRKCFLQMPRTIIGAGSLALVLVAPPCQGLMTGVLNHPSLNTEAKATVTGALSVGGVVKITVTLPGGTFNANWQPVPLGNSACDKPDDAPNVFTLVLWPTTLQSTDGSLELTAMDTHGVITEHSVNACRLYSSTVGLPSGGWSANLGSIDGRYQVTKALKAGTVVLNSALPTIYGRSEQPDPYSILLANPGYLNAAQAPTTLNATFQIASICSISVNNVPLSDGGQISLNHGAVAASSIAETVTKTPVTLGCQGSGVYTIKWQLPSGGTQTADTVLSVPLTTNLTSELFLEGTDRGTVSLSPAQPSLTLDLKSTLRATGPVTGGAYTGSAVLIFSVN